MSVDSQYEAYDKNTCFNLIKPFLSNKVRNVEKATGPNRLRKANFKDNKWQRSYAGTGLELITQKTLTEDPLSRINTDQGRTSCRMFPCYKTDEYKDEDLEMWLIVRETDIKEGELKNVKNRFHMKLFEVVKNSEGIKIEGPIPEMIFQGGFVETKRGE